MVSLGSLFCTSRANSSTRSKIEIITVYNRELTKTPRGGAQPIFLIGGIDVSVCRTRYEMDKHYRRLKEGQVSYDQAQFMFCPTF